VRLDSFLEHIHPARLSADRIRIRATFCLGGVAFFFFMALILTGLLLAVYYLPTPEGAREGLHDLNYVIPFGRLVRSVHFWAGQLMLLAVLSHMARVVAARAYMPPRHLNWLVGVGLLVLVAVLDFSGYVLRWDSQSFWAAQVMTQLLGQVPAVGDALQQLLVGGPRMGEAGLLRFYVLHCLAGPALLLALIFYHFWRVRKDGRAKQAL